MTFLEFVISYSRMILPWLVVGGILSWFVEKYTKPDSIRRFFNSFGLRNIAIAQILGMISPLSIMSLLPVAGSLVSMGAHPALLLTFLMAERAYDLQSFFIISNLFGLRFALLNMAAIFLSLTAASVAVMHEQVEVKERAERGEHGNGFWRRQIKTAGIVAGGILFGAYLRVALPDDTFSHVLGFFSSIGAGSAIGFLLYLGPIMTNYPVARALADIGMPTAGIFALLTITPVFNIIVITLFASVVKLRHVLKAFGVYALAAFVLTCLFVPWLA